MEKIKTIIEVNNLSKIYNNKKQFNQSLKDVSLTIKENQVTSIVGESGSGKTTLAHILSGIIPKTAGEIKIFNQPIEKLQKQSSKKDLQIIFQDSYPSLNDKFPISWTLKEPLKAHFSFTKTEEENEIKKHLHSVGLDEDILSKYPHQLSGGEIQRVAIVASLLVKPKILICDEITSALDVVVKAQIINLILELKSKYQLTVIFITHDLTLAKYISDEIIVMQSGLIVEVGTGEKIFTDPQEEYTKKLIDANLMV